MIQLHAPKVLFDIEYVEYRWQCASGVNIPEIGKDGHGSHAFGQIG